MRRRVQDELGLQIKELKLILPEFRYRAELNGLAENEMCPVFVAKSASELVLNPAEVDRVRWVNWAEFTADVLDYGNAVSPWCSQQLQALAALGPEPLRWPSGDWALLPPAASTADPAIGESR